MLRRRWGRSAESPTTPTTLEPKPPLTCYVITFFTGIEASQVVDLRVCGADDGNRTRVFSLGSCFGARTGGRKPLLSALACKPEIHDDQRMRCGWHCAHCTGWHTVAVWRRYEWIVAVVTGRMRDRDRRTDGTVDLCQPPQAPALTSVTLSPGSTFALLDGTDPQDHVSIRGKDRSLRKVQLSVGVAVRAKLIDHRPLGRVVPIASGVSRCGRANR